MSIEFRQVSVRVGAATLLSDVEATVATGEFVGVIGPNGAGKTTLARAVVGLAEFDGSIALCDVDAATLSSRRRARLVAYVPQRPVLPPGMTVADYVLLGRTPHLGVIGGPSRRDRQIVSHVLHRLELGPFAERRLGTVSGGEAQRAVLARAITQEAPILVLDEPTVALDLGHQQHVLELVDGLRKERNLTVLCALHDLTLAGQFADRLLLVHRGRIVADGDPAAVLTEDRIRTIFDATVRVDYAAGIVVSPVRNRASALRRPAEGAMR